MRIKTKGVHCSFHGFCKACSWQGAHWMGEGARKNALAEYNWHKNQQSHKDAESAASQERKRQAAELRQRVLTPKEKDK